MAAEPSSDRGRSDTNGVNIGSRGGVTLADSYKRTISFSYSVCIALPARPATTHPWLDHLPPATEPVLVRRHRLEGQTPTAALERLRRLAELRHPNLLPILGGEVDGDELHVYYDNDDGRALAALLAEHELRPGPAVAVGLAILSGLKALQKAGLGHGALSADAVRVAAYGQVRLIDYGLAARPVDPRKEVAKAGRLLCQVLGIDPERPLDGRPSRMERALPGVAAAVLSIASGNAGRSAATALMMFGDAAGHLSHRWRVYMSVADLEKLVAPRSPAIAAAVDSALAGSSPPAPSAIRRPRAGPRLRRLWLVPTLLLGATLVLLLSLAPAALASLLPHPRPLAAPAPVAVSTPLQAGAAPAAAARPEAVVGDFYTLVLKHDNQQAAALWSDGLKASLPPAENIDRRFADTTVLTVNEARVTAETDSSATVYTDLTEVTGGVRHHWVGSWRLVKSGGRWLLDQPDFQAA